MGAWPENARSWARAIRRGGGGGPFCPAGRPAHAGLTAVLTGGAHGTERDSERTSGWANERGLRIIERGGRAREGSWR
jgi:hypothetical protein